MQEVIRDWSRFHPDLYVEDQRLNLKLLPSLSMAPWTLDAAHEVNMTHRSTVPVHNVNGVLYLNLDSALLIRKSKSIRPFEIELIDQETREPVALVRLTDQACELSVKKEDVVLDLKCSLFGEESLYIKSPGEIKLSGKINVNAECAIECKSCITDNEGSGVEAPSVVAKKLSIRAKDEVKLSEKFSCQTEQAYFSGALIENRGKVSSEDLIFAATQVSNHGCLNARELTGFAKSFENANEGKIEVEGLCSVASIEYEDAGRVKADRLNIQAERARFHGCCDVSSSACLSLKDECTFSKEAELTSFGSIEVACDKTVCMDGLLEAKVASSDQVCSVSMLSGEDIQLNGALHVSHANVRLNARGAVKVAGLCSSFSDDAMIVQAHEVLLREQLVGFSDVVIKAEKSCDLQASLLPNHALIIESDSVNVEEVIGAQQVTIQASELTLTEHAQLSADLDCQIVADRFYQYGQMSSEAKLFLGINHFFYNKGDIYSSHFHCDTPLLVNLGSVSSKETAEFNALFFLNAGLISAKRCEKYAVFDFDIGLHLLQISNLSSLIDWKTLKEGAKTAAQFVLPGLVKMFQLIQTAYQWLLPLFKKSARESCSEFLALFSSTLKELDALRSEFKRRGISHAPFHSVISLLIKGMKYGAQLHSMTNSINSFQKLRESISKEIQNLKEGMLNAAAGKVDFNVGQVGGLAQKVASALLPEHASHSVVNIQSGVHITARSRNQSYLTHHTALEAALTSLTRNSQYFHNAGILLSGEQVAVSGKSLHDSGVIASASVGVAYDEVTLSSKVGEHRNWSVQSEKLTLENEQVFERSRIKTDTLQCADQSASTFKQSAIQADNVQQASESRVHFKEDTVLQANDVYLTRVTVDHSSVRAKRILKQTKELVARNGATLGGEGVEIENADLSDSSVNAEAQLSAQHITSVRSLLKGGEVKVAESVLQEKSQVHAGNVTISGCNNVTDCQVTAERSIKQIEGKLTGKGSDYRSGQDIQLTHADLEEGSLLAGNRLDVSRSKTTGTRLAGRKLDLSDSEFTGRKTHSAPVQVHAETQSKAVPPSQQDSQAPSRPKADISAEEYLRMTRVTLKDIDVETVSGEVLESRLTNTQVAADNRLYVANNSLNQSQFLGAQVCVDGETAADLSSQVIGRVKEGKVYNEKDELIGVVQSDARGTCAYDLNGRILGKVGADQKSQQVYSGSVISAKKDLDLKGDFRGSSTSLSGENVDISGDITGQQRFSILAENQIATGKSVKLAIEALDMKAHILDQHGVIETTHGYSLDADRAYNWGQMNVYGGSDFNVRQVMANITGRMRSDNMRIRAGVFANVASFVHANTLEVDAGVSANIAGEIVGYDALNINAAVSLNILGMMRSMHVKNSAVLKYDLAGVYLPALPSDPKQLLSWSSAANVGATLLNNVTGSLAGLATGAGKALGFLFSSKSTVDTGRRAINEISAFAKKAIQNPRDINIGEIVGALSRTKDAVLGVSNLSSYWPKKQNEASGQSVQQDNPSEAQTVEQVNPSTLQSASYQQQAVAAVATVGAAYWDTVRPSCNTDAVFNFGDSRVISGSVSENSMYSDQAGFTIADAVTVGSYSFHNRRDINARAFSGDCRYVKNDAEIDANCFSMRARRYDNNGTTRASFARGVEVGTWNQSLGSTQFGSGSVKINQLNAAGGLVEFNRVSGTVDCFALGERAQVDWSGCDIQVKDRTNIAGGFTARDGAQVQLGDLTLEKTGALNAQSDSVVTAKETQNSGRVSLVNSKMAADRYTASEGSVTSLKTTAPSEKPDEARTVLVSQAKLTIDGQLDNHQSVVGGVGEVEFGDNAQLNLTQASVLGRDIQLNNASATVSGVNVLKAENRLDQSEGGHVDGSGLLAFMGEAGAIKGSFSASSAVVNIKCLEGKAQDLIYGRGVYERFLPTESLGVSTDQRIVFDDQRLRDVHLAAAGSSIEVQKRLSTAKGLLLDAATGELVLHEDVSAGDLSLSSETGITNHGRKISSNTEFNFKVRNGDFRNNGGVLEAQYIDGYVNGDFYNDADNHSKNSPPKAACMVSGKGREDGVALRLHTTGKVHNNASVIYSLGTNQIDADKGYEGKSAFRHQVTHERKKGWYRGSEVRKKVTTVYGSSVTSARGKNRVVSRDGHVKAEAGSFISQDGTDLIGKSHVRLLGVKTRDSMEVKQYSFFGLNRKSVSESHQKTTHSMIYDAGQTVVRSYEGDVYLQDTNLVGPGRAELDGRKVDVLSTVDEHVINRSSSGFGMRAFGSDVVQAMASGGNVQEAVLGLDPTVKRAGDLCRNFGQSASQTIADFWNAGFSGYNAYQSVAQAGSAATALLTRTGLGDRKGLNPSMDLTYGHSSEHIDYQTLSGARISRSGLTINARETAHIHATPTDINGDMKVNAQEFKQTGQALKSHQDSQSTSISLGVTPKGGVVSAGVSHQQQECQATTTELQRTTVAGNLEVNANRYIIDGATMTASTASGHVEQLVVRSNQDVEHASALGFHASTSGDVGANVSASDTAVTREQSALCVQDQQHSSFTATQTDLRAAHVPVRNASGVDLGSLTQRSLVDRDTGYHLAASTNVLQCLASQTRSQADVSSRSLPAVSTQFGFQDYHAHQQSSLLSMPVAPQVVTDTNVHLNLDVPIMRFAAISDEQQPAVSVDPLSDIILNIPAEAAMSEIPQSAVAQNVSEKHDPVGPRDPSRVSRNEAAAVSLAGQLPAEVSVQPDEQHKSEAGVIPLSHQSESESDDRYGDMAFDPDLAYANVAYKKGRARNQLFDRDTGQYTSHEKTTSKVKEENKKSSPVQKSASVSVRHDFFELGENAVHLQLSNDSLDALGMRPTLLSQYGGRLEASYDPSESSASAEIGFNAALRLNLMHAASHGDYGTARLTADLFGAQMTSRVGIECENTLQALAEVEIGLMGPNAKVEIETPALCVAGLRFQFNGSASAGLGCKASAGAGIVVDKINPKMRLGGRVGLFSGVGAQLSGELGISCDAKADSILKEEAQKLLETPMFKHQLEQIKAEQDRLAKETPTGFLPILWHHVKSHCMQEAEFDLAENVGQIAAAALLKPRIE